MTALDDRPATTQPEASTGRAPIGTLASDVVLPHGTLSRVRTHLAKGETCLECRVSVDVAPVTFGHPP